MINKGVMVMKISTYLTFCLCAVALMTTSTSFAHEFTDVTVECTDGDNVRRIDWVTGMETVKWRGNSCKVVLATDEKLILTGKNAHQPSRQKEKYLIVTETMKITHANMIIGKRLENS